MTTCKNRRRLPGTTRTDRGQKGIALIMALIVLSILSLLAAGVMSTTQSEIWSTANYRNAIQARYVAEAGAQQAAMYIANSPKVATNLPGAFTAPWNSTNFPITYSGEPVFIQSSPTNPVPTVTNSQSSTTSTFPYLDLVTDFQTQVGGAAASSSPFAFSGGASTGGYSVAIQLLAVQPITGGWLTKWKIVSIGSVTGVKTSKVQVVETVEGNLKPSDPPNKALFNYALYATGTGCDVVKMSGGQDSESFDSKSGTTTNTHHGDIASNGSISLSSYTIDGAVYSPLSAGITSKVQPYAINVAPWNGPYIGGGYDASTCPQYVNDPLHHFAVYEDSSGLAAVTNGAGNPRNNGSLPGCYQNKNCPTGYNTFNYLATLPVIPDPITNPVATTGAGCTSDLGCNGNANWNASSSPSWTLGSTAATFVNSKYNFGLSPSKTKSYGAVTVGSAPVIMHLAPGTYNFDSLNISGSGQIVLDTPASCANNACQVTINIIGSQATQGQWDQGVININGAGIANNTGTPGNLLINYNGAGNVSMTGSGTMWGTIDAPHAAFYNTGGALIYGAVIAKTASLQGSGQIRYDTQLGSGGGGGGTPVYAANPLFVSEFSWSTY